MAAVFCTNCGTQLADRATFCHSCGTRCEATKIEVAAIKEEVARLIKEYKSSHDETVAARIQQLNRSLQRPATPLQAQAQPPRKPRLSSYAKKSILQLAGILLLIIFFAKVCSGPSEADKAHTEALKSTAVQAVKDNFEPAYDMLVLNPDTATGNWYATDNYGVYECQGECVVVYYSVDVMPSGGTEKKRMDFKWLYDTKRPLPVFANTEAHTYFQPKQ